MRTATFIRFSDEHAQERWQYIAEHLGRSEAQAQIKKRLIRFLPIGLGDNKNKKTYGNSNRI